MCSDIITFRSSSSNLNLTPLEGLDFHYYSSLDPCFFYIASEASRLGSIPNMKVENPDGTVSNAHPILDNIKKSKDSADKIKSSLQRFYRYLSAETMLVNILAAPPHNPAYRVTSTLRGAKLTEAFASIGKGAIPLKFRVKVDKRDVKFIEWLGIKIFGDSRSFDSNDMKSISDFVQSEAEFSTNRSALNSFKHSRPVTFGSGMRIKITPEGGDESVTSVPINGVDWAEWSESHAGFAINFQSEEFDVDQDRVAILYNFMLIDVMKKVRLHQINKSDKSLKLEIPIFSVKIRKVVKQNFCMRFDRRTASSEEQK